MSEFDDAVFQRLCELKNAVQNVARPADFSALPLSLDELVYSLQRLQQLGFCYILPYPKYATCDFQTFAVEIYFEAIDDFLGSGQ